MITLKTLDQTSAQEVFNQVATHLLTQKQRAFNMLDGRCVYRARELSCAAGCLIGTSEYARKFEGKLWTELVDKGYVPSTHSNLITLLQEVHDSEDIKNWKRVLRQLAKHKGLSSDVLNNF